MVGDGHAKVITKCAGHLQHAGQPRSNKTLKKTPFTNGWFFVCEPTGRVLVVQQQVNPVNNRPLIHI